MGFPGPEHHIAEREWPMKIPMAILAVLSIIGGAVQIPGVDDMIEQFLEGSFEGSALFHIVPSTEDAWIGLAIGGVISILGISLAYYCFVKNPGVTVRLAERLRPLHTFLMNKWYFDELYDWLVYRPVIAIGRFCNAVVERVVVNGLVGATTGVVRGFGGWVRGAQTGFVRAYALLLITGFAALGLYFLLAAA